MKSVKLSVVRVVKGYLMAAEIVPEPALGKAFLDWPASTLTVFVAMMFAGTVGGNATLVGASANVVAPEYAYRTVNRYPL